MIAPRGLTEIAFVAAKSIRPEQTGEWAKWQSQQAAAHDGALWQLLDPAPPGMPGAGHSHVVHLPTSSLVDFDQSTLQARPTAPGSGHAEIERDTWMRHGSEIVTESEAALTGLIVAQVLCADPEREAEWDGWYDEQHLPDMMASGAFVAGTRWRRADDRPGTANNLTIYEIAGLSTEDAIERSASAMGPLVAAGRKHPCHTGGRTWALHRCD